MALKAIRQYAGQGLFLSAVLLAQADARQAASLTAWQALAARLSCRQASALAARNTWAPVTCHVLWQATALPMLTVIKLDANVTSTWAVLVVYSALLMEGNAAFRYTICNDCVALSRRPGT